MHRFASFAAVAVLPLAVASSSGALAQQKTIKEMIAGSWSIVSAIDKYEDGTSKNPWGPGVKGNTLFDGNGHFSQILISGPEASMKTADPRRPDAYVVAYYGTYTVNEADRSISTKLEYAAYSARAGAQFTWKVSGSGDALTFVGSPRKDQHGTFSPIIEIKRVK